MPSVHFVKNVNTGLYLTPDEANDCFEEVPFDDAFVFTDKAAAVSSVEIATKQHRASVRRKIGFLFGLARYDEFGIVTYNLCEMTNTFEAGEVDDVDGAGE